MVKKASVAENVTISAPDFGVLQFIIKGTAPLVVERFSKKLELMAKMSEGGQAKNKKVHKARDYEKDCEESRYRHSSGWEGVNAASFRAAMISACRLVGFKMTIAKLSVFIEADGFDQADGLPLVRIYGDSRTFTTNTRNATGVIDIRSRPQYREWACKLNVKFDRAQFTTADVLNLVSRVGGQVGIGAGRPDSKASAGCGWGTFEVVGDKDLARVKKQFKIAR